MIIPTCVSVHVKDILCAYMQELNMRALRVMVAVANHCMALDGNVPSATILISAQNAT